MQFSPTIVHRMLAYRQTSSGIVGDQAFFDIHFLQWKRIGIFAQVFAGLPEQRTFEFSRAFDLPQSVSAMADTIKAAHLLCFE